MHVLVQNDLEVQTDGKRGTLRGLESRYCAESCRGLHWSAASLLTCALSRCWVPAARAGALLNVVRVTPAATAHCVRLVAALTYTEQQKYKRHQGPPGQTMRWGSLAAATHRTILFPCPSCPWCLCGPKKDKELGKGRVRGQGLAQGGWHRLPDSTDFSARSFRSVICLATLLLVTGWVGKI